MRLTDIAVRQLPLPASGQRTYFDNTLPSFGCRVSKGGTRSFVVQHGADRQLITIGRYPVISLASARTEAKRILAERALGKHRPTSIPFEEAKAVFLEECKRKNKPRTIYDYTRVLNRHFSFRKRQLSDITPSDINRKLDCLADTPAEQRYALVVAKVFFGWAVRRHHIERSPCEGMRSPFRIRSRERVLSNQELKAIWRAADTYPFGPIVRLLILTGQRRGEIGSLHRNWINSDEKTIALPSEVVKNGRPHTFPFGNMTTGILDALPTFDCDLVFPARGNNKAPFSGWSKCKQVLDTSSGITGWTLHDLRRTFATNLAALDTAPHVVERLLNHASGTISGVAAIYNRFQYAAEMRAAIEMWEKHLKKLLA